jgi:hypothetical protein
VHEDAAARAARGAVVLDAQRRGRHGSGSGAVMQEHQPEGADCQEPGDPAGDLAWGDLGHAAIVAAISERISSAL